MCRGSERVHQSLPSTFFISKQPLSFCHAKQRFSYQGKNPTSGTNCKLLQQNAQTIKSSDWFFITDFSLQVHAWEVWIHVVHETEQRSIENKGLNQREGGVVETVGGKSMWEERSEEERGDRKGTGSWRMETGLWVIIQMVWIIMCLSLLPLCWLLELSFNDFHDVLLKIEVSLLFPEGELLKVEDYSSFWKRCSSSLIWK